MKADEVLQRKVACVERGEAIGDVRELFFRDPDNFRARELRSHSSFWETIAERHPSTTKTEVLGWIRDKVSLFLYFQHFTGLFKGERYDSDRPPRKLFRSNMSCKSLANFVRKTLLNRLTTGAISLLGKVVDVKAPHIVLSLTVEPSKPRLCHDARYLNLWMRDKPFTLDSLNDLPRYVAKDSYQTVLDAKSGYDHILLTDECRTFLGIKWGGWYFTYNSLPFGWKISPYVYHTRGLLATKFFRSIGIPCLLYIDDRHNGQLQVPLEQGDYGTLSTADERRFAAAKSAIFFVAFYLVRMGYFLGLSKSMLTPLKIVPYLGFLADSSMEVFHFIPENKHKFVTLVQETINPLMFLLKRCNVW